MTLDRLIRTMMAALMINGSAFSNIMAQQLEKKIKLFIEPGHTPDSPGGIADATGFQEYLINDILAQKLLFYFRQDPRFNVTETKNNGEYVDEIKTIADTNRVINGVIKKPKSKDPKVPYERRKEIAALKILDADAVIALHADDSRQEIYQGYHVIISPLDKDYKKSKQIALCISDELRKIMPISNHFHNSRLGNKSSEVKYLNSKGIALRGNLLALSNKRLKAKTPIILIEDDFIYNYPVFKIGDYFFLCPESEEKLNKSAEAIYKGILNFYNLQELPFRKPKLQESWPVLG